MLIRFDPFREFDRWTQQFRAASAPVLPMDAYRQGDQFVVHFDLPGVDPASVDLTVEKNVLTVKAERSWSTEEGQEWLVAERTQGAFTRQLFLGETLDTEHIQANYENGVLTVTIPVAEVAKPRKVEIGGGSRPAIETSAAA